MTHSFPLGRAFLALSPRPESLPPRWLLSSLRVGGLTHE